MDLVGIVLLAAGVLGVATFVGIYTWWTPWWRSETGQWLVIFPGSLGLLLANGLAFRIFGDYAGRQIINLVAFTVCMACTWWSVRLLIRVIRRRRVESDS